MEAQPYVPPPPRQLPDPTIQLRAPGVSEVHGGIDNLSDPVLNFAGIPGFLPPDTTGDVGRNHFVQMINATEYRVWDKQGNPLAGPITFGNLWVAAGDTGPCTENKGDPIVVYDHLADRWLLSQFADPNHQCIAISQTPDPSVGTWFLYTFDTGAFPDYPKFGVWPDGYYMSSFEGDNLGVYVFDRINMVLGNAAGFFKDTISSLGIPGVVRRTRILPSDLDGPPPAAGTPNFFLRTVDDQQDPGTSDRIEIYEAEVDWGIAPNPGAFSFTLVDTLSPAAFDIMLCARTGQGGRDCIPQPDTDETVDALSNRPMMQLKYRNFESHQAMVFNQTIDVSGSIAFSTGITPAGEVAGIRWYELRNTGASWMIDQQGTFAPQPIDPDDEPELIHRWMGSAAIDALGNFAIGYSVGNDDSDPGEQLYPGIRYAGRLADDPAGFLAQGEKTLLNGTTSENGPCFDKNDNEAGCRWGDYSALSVDPVDDCTFWYTTHDATGATQIGSFRFSMCETDLAITKTASPDPVVAGEQLTYTVSVENNGPLNVSGVTVADTLPSEVTYLADTDACVEDPIGTLTCELGELAAGASSSFDIEVLVDGDTTTLTNVAEVFSDQGESDPSNNTATATTEVTPSADLAIAKTDTPDPVVAGEGLTYEIEVTNDGPSTAVNVVVDDALPAQVTVDQVSSSAGTCQAGVPGDAAQPTRCTFDSLAPGVTETMTIDVTVRPQATGTLTNDASVASDVADPNNANDLATTTTTVQTSADLSIIKTDSADPVIAGDLLTYTLLVFNDGPSTARAIEIQDTLPQEVAFVSAAPATGPGSCELLANSAVSCADLGDLDPGATRTVFVNVVVDPSVPDGATIDNAAAVSSETPDPVPANNADNEGTLVTAEADLSLTKDSNLDTVGPSKTIIYTLAVTNNGLSDAQDVLVFDQLPSVKSGNNEKVVFEFATEGCTYDPTDPHSVACDVGTLAAGATATFKIHIHVKGSPGLITNVAMASSTTTDPDSSNNTAEKDVHVGGGANK